MLRELRKLQEEEQMNEIALARGLGGTAIAQPSPREHLVWKKERLEKELERVNKAIAAFDANPQIEEVLTLYADALRG